MMARVLACVLCLFAPAAAFQLTTLAPTRSMCSATMSAALKTGDMVTVISGGDKGTAGKILFMDRKNGKVLARLLRTRASCLEGSRLRARCAYRQTLANMCR